MAQIYDLPNETHTEGIFELFDYVVTLTDGLFFAVIMLVTWLIVFISTLKTGSSFDNRSAAGSFTLASFICFILSIPLTITEVLATKYMYLSLVFTAFGIVWVYLSDSN